MSSAPWHAGQLFDDVDDQAVECSYEQHTGRSGTCEKNAWARERRALHDVSLESAIRAKRKANDKYLRNETPENWELRRIARNEATKQRRIAIKQYWYKKSNDLKEKQSQGVFQNFQVIFGF